MSARLFPDRTLDQALAESCLIAEMARDSYRPTKTFLLFSGGNDSMVLLDAMGEYADAIVHINTGIGIPEATQFARDTAARYPLPFIELEPPESYESLVLTNDLWDGLPGPAFHNIVYQRLKERCIAQLLRDHRTYRGERFVLLSGIRRAESPRRTQRREAIERSGGRVFCKPLFRWRNEEMRAYRDLHDLPVNPVAANLHMSGECLCGAMADQDEARSERAAIRFFYPEFDARLTALEAECVALGKTHCEWGVKRPIKGTVVPAYTAYDDDGNVVYERAEYVVARDGGGDDPGMLCQSCEFRQEAML